MTAFETNLSRWQSITEDAKEQQHADAIAIDESLDKRAERKQADTFYKPGPCKCAHCGEHGETTGHMGCQYPEDH